MHLYLRFHQKAVQNIQVNSTLMSRIIRAEYQLDEEKT
jgi:hypothetical protein